MDHNFIRNFCEDKWYNDEMYRLMKEFNESRKKEKKFVDGPPFVSGSLHHGHVCIGILKDFMIRWLRMNDYRVDLTLGFDTHGLPVEAAVNKKLEIKTKEDMEDIGISEYNKECKNFVMDNANSWKPLYKLFGRWCDFSDKYMTMDYDCMKKFWKYFSDINDKGLIYIGYKVMPYSTELRSPISNTESSENYKEVTSPSIFVKFKVKDSEDTYFIAWTTTPWTLPSNLILCIHKEITYVYVLDKETGSEYILSKNTLKNLYGKKKKLDNSLFEIRKTVKGEKLIGKKYIPIFDYFKEDSKKDKYFKILHGEHVKDSTDKNCVGTGIVHTAPGFGIDDYKVCIDNNIIEVEESNYCPVNDIGQFTDTIHDYSGKYVFDTNKMIIDRLREEKSLVKRDNISHKYPYCPRTDTPLLYKLSSGVFIRVTDIKDDLLRLSKEINWSPEYINKRYTNWLKNSTDWCISRNRVFGTPIPLWISDDSDTIIISSPEELKDEAKLDSIPDDIHPEYINEIVIEKNGKKYKRVPYVFDCWFESGSVPLLNSNDSIDFVIEGVDQTSNWFYNSAVLFSILKNKNVFKNIICTGLVLAEDGKKMSKRSKNYPDPGKVLLDYNADACRMYICNSQVIQGDNLPFSLNHLDKVKNKFSPWYNSMIFFLNYYNRYYQTTGLDINKRKVTNIMDLWIIGRLKRLIIKINKEMENYKINNVFPLIFPFIEDLTNWYIKLNRDRLKGDTEIKEWGDSLYVLHTVLINFVKLMAPMTPFITEYMYEQLKNISNENNYSVHITSYPKEDYIEEDIDDNELDNIEYLRNIIDMIRELRSEKIEYSSVKMPIKRIKIYNRDKDVLKGLEKLIEYINTEGNIINVEFRQMDNIIYCVKINHKIAGKKFKKDKKIVENYISLLKQDDILKLNRGESLNIIIDKEYLIEPSDVVIYAKTSFDDDNVIVKNVNELYVTFDLGDLNDSEVRQRYVSIMINFYVQQARKDAGLNVSDNVEIEYKTSSYIDKIIYCNKDFLSQKLHTEMIKGNPNDNNTKKVKIMDDDFIFKINIL